MSADLTHIVLVGSLGRAPGVERTDWYLDVKSPAEAVRAIDINTRGALQRYLTGSARERMYRIALQKRENVIDAEREIGNRSGRSTIYIMPAIRGRNSGVGKIIVGAALIALSFFNPFAAGTIWNVAFAAVTVGFGTSLVLGGISQLLTPKAQNPTAQAQAQSTLFPGNATAVVQGGCIPVVYGHALVSPIPVSVTVTNNDVSSTAAGTLGSVTTTPLPGGGSQNAPGDDNNPP